VIYARLIFLYRSFEKQQKERQLQIVTKLLDEEKIAQRQEQKKVKSHWHTRMDVSHPQASNKVMLCVHVFVPVCMSVCTALHKQTYTLPLLYTAEEQEVT